MHPYQHGGEENRVQHSESENNPSDIGRDTDTDFETYVMSELQAFLGNYNNKEQPSGERNSRPLQDPNDGEQQSADRHSRPLEDPNDGEQLSADRHSRPLEDPDDGKQPSGDKSPEGEAGPDSLALNDQNGLASVRGKIKGKDETLKYLHREKWVPAVYHDAVRHYLIEQAEKLGKYDHPRERGIEPDNVTSFLKSQKSWGPVRDKNWADILYVFEKKESSSPKDDPVYWKVGKRIVLASRDSKPILKYNDIPATLSTQLAGRDMEAIKRTDPRIRQRDFIARMPKKYTTRTGKRRNAKSASWIGMEMTRFRQRHGMLSWVGREGSDVIRAALWERLPQQNKNQNTIRGLAPPSPLEQEKVRQGNVGKFVKNAGVRALPDDERAKRQQRKERRQLQKRGHREGPATGISGYQRSNPTATTSGVDGGRGQHGRDSSTRSRPDFPDSTTRQDRGQEYDESDTAPPIYRTQKRIGSRLRHRPRGHPQEPRERPSASCDLWMQPLENPTQDGLPPTPPPPPQATVNYFDLQPLSPPDYEAYLERQARQRKAAQQTYK